MLERALELGAIPALCAGASACHCLYALKVSSAAQQWRALDLSNDRMKQRAAAHATALSQHGASVLALSAISAVIAGEALSDWLMIRRLPSTTSHLAGLELSLRTRMPFFLRPSVVLTAGTALYAAKQTTGAVQFRAPSRPFLGGVQGVTTQESGNVRR